MRNWLAFALVGLTMAACGTTEDNRIDRRVKIPPAPENGIQYILPERTIAPHSEEIWCAFYKSPDTDVWITAMEPFQNNGHHLVAFTADTDVEDGHLEECEDAASMATWRPLTPSLDRFELPDGYATRLPANTTLVFQFHYINYYDEPIRIRDVYQMEFAAKDAPDPIPATSIASGTIDYMIPPQQSYSVAYECTMEQQTNGILMFGHMHEWGTSLSIDIVRDSESPETVYDVPQWEGDFRDTPPLLEWDPGDPLVLEPGDKLRVHCNWQNNSDTAIGFPQEMCAAVLWYYPGDQPRICGGDAL